MVEILIKPSKKADKKFDAIIDGKNLCLLDLLSIQILQNIKMKKENKDTWTDIRQEKTGAIQLAMEPYLSLFYGKSQQFPQV